MSEKTQGKYIISSASRTIDTHIKSILIVSGHPLDLVADAADRRGVETIQVHSYDEYQQAQLSTYSICITDMLPDQSQSDLDGFKVLQACAKADQPVAVFAHALTTKQELATYASGSIGCFRMGSVTADDLLNHLNILMQHGGIYIHDDKTRYQMNLLKCYGDNIFIKLNQSEIDVIIRLVSGHSYKRIGIDLNVIDGTLRNKISKMLTEVDMSVRQDLINHAHVLGVLPLDDAEFPIKSTKEL